MPESPPIRCPRCKKQQPRSGKCIECGLDFKQYMTERRARAAGAGGPTSSQGATASTSGEKGESAPGAMPPRKIRCPKCGTSQLLGNFCIECGLDFKQYAAKRRAGAEPPPQSERTARFASEADASPPKDKGVRDAGVRDAPADLDTLFSRTWDAYKRRVLTLVALYIIAGVMFIVPAVVLVGIGIALVAVMQEAAVAYVAGLVLIGTLVVTYLFGAGFGALTAAVMDDSLKAGPALKRGFTMAMPYIWVFSLAGFVAGGGFFILIVPGIVLLVWFAFSKYLIFAEPGVSGLDAMLKSREYIRGHGWDTFFKLFLIVLLSMMAGMLPVIGQIFFMPFMMLYIRMMYEDLVRLKGGDMALPKGIWNRYKYILLGFTGWLIPFMLMLLVIIPIAGKLKDTFGPFPNFPNQLPGHMAPFDGKGLGGALSSTTLSTEKQVYAPMERIAVRYSGMPGNSQDWITVVPADAPEDEFGEWYYTEGQTSGEMRFVGLAPGQYEARAYHDWPSGGFDIRARAVFAVELAPGQSVTSQSATGRSASGESAIEPGKRLLAPSESFAVSYRVPRSAFDAGPNSEGLWAVLVQESVPHDNALDNKNAALEFQPLGNEPEGELIFQAPQFTGAYEIRIFAGGSDGSEAVELASAGFAVAERKFPRSVRVHAEGEGPVEVRVYIYSLNYKGSVNLNGQEFYIIGGEPEMNYNSTQSAELMAGSNRFEVRYNALPGNPWKTSLKLKVYAYDYASQAEHVIAEWDLADEGGHEVFEVIVEGVGIKT